MSGSNDKKNRKTRAAQHILTNWEYYKVCEGCESVILHDHIFCPLCSGYRFNEEYKVLENVVTELVKRDLTDILNEKEYFDDYI